jgi:hypothetical protein
MLRTMRVEYPGAIYHVMDRSDRREDIFLDDVDRQEFRKNPVRAGLVGKEDRLLAYPWSNLVWYLAAPEHRPSWIRVDRLLGEHGIQQDCPAGRQEFERHLEARRSEEEDEAALKSFRREWCLGGRGVQKADARIDGRNAGGEPLRGTSPGKRRAKGESDHLARNGAPGLGGSRFGLWFEE